ncbi:MAG: hypothetical protein SFX73_23925 [Kofleriaceae bacterium]|nr:hypothetical protein [Kofleriaceae bacterium]
MSGFANELPTPEPARVHAGSFGHGVATGLALAMVAFHVWLSRQLSGLAAIWQELPWPPLALTTRLAYSTEWQVIVPALGAAMILVLVLRRPRAWWPYFAVMLVLVVAIAISWYGSRAPFTELSHDIR